MTADIPAAARATAGRDVAGPGPWILGALALLAAAPSVLWAAVGGPLSDDWAIWATFHGRGLLDGLVYNAFTSPGRPGAGVLYALVYGVAGPNTVVHGAVLGAANAGLIVGAWWAGRCVLPPRVLAAGLLVLAVAPNHATTRLWPATTTHPVALGLTLVGLGAVLRGRPAVAAALLAAAVLVHEGVVVLVVASVLVWVMASPRLRWRHGALAVLPAVGSAMFVLIRSPKRGGDGPSPLNNAESFVPAQLGIGLWEHPLLARLGVLTVVGFVGLAVVRSLPSYRSDRPEYRFMVLGAVLAAVGAVPYAYLGTTFATAGFFDRSNLLPSVGVALILASIWSLVASRSLVLAALLGVGAVAVLVEGQIGDVRAFEAAASDGTDLVEEIVEFPGLDRSSPVLVLDSRDPRGTGVAAYVYDGDLAAALLHRTGVRWDVRLSENLRCDALEAEARVQVVDWRAGEWWFADADSVRAGCVDWQGR